VIIILLTLNMAAEAERMTRKKRIDPRLIRAGWSVAERLGTVHPVPGVPARGAEPPPPDTLQRRFLSTAGHILNHGNQIVVRPDRRTYSPVLRQANLPDISVPWLGGRTIRYEFA
jgi:hypothetical protein